MKLTGRQCRWWRIRPPKQGKVADIHCRSADYGLCGAGVVIEDTSLDVDGADVCPVSWHSAQLDWPSDCRWE